MEREYHYFDFDSVPSDIWRLIFKQLRTLTDLRSFNSINKSCHNYSKYYMQKQKLWLGLFKKKFGLDGMKIASSILPSKLVCLEKLRRPTLKMDRSKVNLDGPLKIIVIGDGGVGKTSYTMLVSGKEVDRRYIPTLGCEVRTITIKSTNKNYTIGLWDTAGPERFGALRDGYYIGAHGAIVMADVTSAFTLKNIPSWMKDIRRICGEIPLAVCINKADATDAPKFLINRLTITQKHARKSNAMFCEMSCWANYNVHEPLIWIMQQLTGDDTLELTFPAVASLRDPSERLVLNANTLRTSIMAMVKSADYNEEDDDFEELPKRDDDPFYAIKVDKRRVLEDVIRSCSPRVKSVMESLLTGVRTGPALNIKLIHPLQRPSLLFVEGLSCSEFHPIQNFNFVQPLLEFYQQHEDAITMEAKSLMAHSGLDDMTSSVNGSWKSFYFVESGRINHTSTDTAPLLTQMVCGVSPSLMTCSFGYAYISILGPHSHITPHCGPCNIKLRCHLPLIVPSEGCTLRVGSTIKSFKQGELLIFDDSIEHEVHNNDSSSSRVILLFDIWHPDLTSDEINSFNTYFSVT